MQLAGRIIDNRYEIIDRIGEGGMSVVWLAQDTRGDKQIALKVLKEETTSHRVEDIIRFHKESAIVSRMLHENIVRTYGIGEYEGLSYIVMELIKGSSLHNLMERGATFSQDEAVEIVRGVCSALEYVHNSGVIHRDLKPGNIMIVTGNGSDVVSDLTPKLVDFGLAGLRELARIEEEYVVGTLSYISPEQSGIIRRPVDERSDLYSLGVIFYQLLSGELPFKGEDISTILHQQIAKVPDPPSRLKEDIPEVLEEMVLKLLSKEQEERYQSARGLLADLSRYQEGGTDFALGKEDKLIRLPFRTRLVGREEEISHLRDLFNQASDGRGKVCLISGEAGRGKTRLVEELRGYVYEKDGAFLSGRCFDQENKIPYQPFREALNEYINSIQRRKEEEKEQVTERIRESVGELGEVITRLNPLMKEILGDVLPLVSLEPERENKRFLMVCSRFLCSLGENGRPVVLLLDDLQWADEGSLSLLGEVAQDIGKSPLLILGTYRDNEVSSEHSLMKLKTEAEEREYPLEGINLSLLDYPRTNRLVADLLLEKEDRTKEISRYILDKSRGNPFFAIEILRQLVDEEVVFHHHGGWDVDWEGLQEREISPTILDIVLRRMSLLEKGEVNLLSYAAAIGRTFDLNLLFKLSELAEEGVVSIIDKAIELQLLEESLTERGRILFVHDRIKDAFYQKIGGEKRRELHLEIAKAIEEANREDLGGVVFDLAHHYTEGGDKGKSLEYAVPAANKANESYANEEVIRYSTIARDLLEGKGEKGSGQWVEIIEGLGEIYLRVGRNDDAIEIFDEILSFKETDIEKAKIYRHLSTAYFKRSNWANCEEQARRGLRLLGERLPITKTGVISGLVKELSIHVIHSLFPRMLVHKKGKHVDEKYPLVIWFYITLDWLYILSDTTKFIRSVLRMLNVAESRIGRSRELGMSIGAYASVCMAIPLFKRAIRYHEKGLRLRRELGDEWGIAQSLQWIGFCYQWKGDYENSHKYFRESLDRFQKIGDMWEIGMVLIGLYYNYFYSSDYETGFDNAHQRLETTQKMKDDLGTSSAEESLSMMYTEIGEFDKAEEWGMKGLALSEEKEITIVNCIANIRLGYLNLERGNHTDALKYLEKAKILNEENNFLKDFVVPLYPYLAETYLLQYTEEEKGITVKEKKLYLKKIRRACKDALHETKSWANHYGGALRVQGKYHALMGNGKKAEEFFLRSIEHCSRLGGRYELAKGCYEYGNWLNGIGRGEEAKGNWEEAYILFKEIGSKVYEKRVANMLGIGQEEGSPQERLLERSRLSSIIGLSQHISSILNLDELLEDIMDKAIQVTGARRGYLLIADEGTGELKVRSARNIDRDEISSEEFQFSKGIVYEVYRTGKRVITTNAQREENYARFQSVISYGLKSILCVPIRYREEITGVCYLDNPLSSSVFTEDEADLLNVFVSQAAISIENAHAYETIARKVNQLSSLHDIGTAITSILDMDQLLDTVLEIVVHDLGYDRAMIMLVDEERGILSSGRGIGGTNEMVRFIENLELPIKEDGGVLSRVVMSGNPILVSDVSTTDLKMDMDIIATLETRSFLAMPLKTKEKVIGIMAADNFRSGERLTESDESLLSTLAGQVAISVENARLVEEVAERERMKQELEIAYNIQVGLLPESDPEIAGFEIMGESIPAEEVGGDFYNYYHLDNRKLCIAIGDVSGKGISAAMIMAVTSGMIDSEAKKSSSASSLIDCVNRLLIPRAKPSRMNSALLYAILDSGEKRLRVANAGMIPPLVCRGDGSGCDYMDVKGIPLGITTIYEYEEREVKLHSNDIVVLSSDGIVEAINGDGEEFGFDGLQQVVYRNKELSAHNLTEKILGEVRGFVGSETLQDDITIVILKVSANIEF